MASFINKIKSLDDLKNYILTRLGHPVIDVEVTDDQLNAIIESTIQKFSEVALEGQLEKALILDILPDVYEYKLDDRIRSVIEVVTTSRGGLTSAFQVHGMLVTKSDFFGTALPVGGPGFDLGNLSMIMSKFSALEEMFSITPNFSYSSGTNILSFTDDIQNIVGGKVLLHAFTYYDINPDNDGIFNHEWVKDYALACTEIQWGKNLGKYDATLISGEKLNYDRMINTGTADRDRLDMELYSKWSQPFGVYR